MSIDHAVSTALIWIFLASLLNHHNDAVQPILAATFMSDGNNNINRSFIMMKLICLHLAVSAASNPVKDLKSRFMINGAFFLP